MGQEESLEVGEDLLTSTEIPHQIPTNLEEMDKDAVGSNLMREDMAKIWSTKYLLGSYERGLLVWHHWLYHCFLKFLPRLSQRGIIPRKLVKFIKLSPTRGRGGPKANSQVGQ